jgi:hypothetical protein
MGASLQPLTVLIGIVMGSSVALLTGLTMTLVVFLLMPDYHERLAGEFAPLWQAIAWAALLTVASATSFVGLLKGRSWRLAALLCLGLTIGLVTWTYWPA